MLFIEELKSISIGVTDRCNLRCKYCYHFSGPSNVNKDLPLQEWLTFFKELQQAGIEKVGVGGGEPFIRADIKEILTGIVRHGMRFSMVSNGALITDEMAKFIAATKKCIYIQISIDGSKAEVHDIFRGDGSFVKAVRGIKILQKHKIPVTSRVTIHHKNVNDLENIAKFLLEDIGLSNFSTNSACYMGLCRKTAEQVQLTIADRTLAMRKLLTLNKKYDGRITSQAGPLTEANLWLKMQRKIKEGEEMQGGGCLGTCPGILRELGVRADGVIVPCNQISHIELGRINQDSLLHVWYAHQELIRLRSRSEKPLTNFEYCQDCDYVKLCSGGCPAMAHSVTGKDDVIAPEFCLKKFLEDGGKLPEDLVTAANS